jgi:hypothetical protein
LRHNFCFSYKIVIFTEKCSQEHRINCPTIILKESELPKIFFFRSVIALSFQNVTNLAEYQTGCPHTAWRWTKPNSSILGRDKCEVMDIHKQTTKIGTLLQTSNNLAPVQCIVQT